MEGHGKQVEIFCTNPIVVAVIIVMLDVLYLFDLHCGSKMLNLRVILYKCRFDLLLLDGCRCVL